jgi:hypothetical protein
VSQPIKTEAAAATGRTIRESGDRVHQIAVPPTARALSSLSHIDYADAFLVEAGLARQWSAEQCGRTVLDGAPLAARTNLLLGWSAIGLKPAIGGSSRSILGWEIRVSAPEFVLLGRDSLIGMPGELLVNREHDAFLHVRATRQSPRTIILGRGRARACPRRASHPRGCQPTVCRCR